MIECINWWCAALPIFFSQFNLSKGKNIEKNTTWLFQTLILVQCTFWNGDTKAKTKLKSMRAHSTPIHNSNRWFEHAAVWHTRSSDANFCVCELFDCSLPLSAFPACRSFTHPWRVRNVQCAMCKTQCLDKKAAPNLVFFTHNSSFVECHTHTLASHSNYTHPWMQRNTAFYAITANILRDFHSKRFIHYDYWH